MAAAVTALDWAAAVAAFDWAAFTVSAFTVSAMAAVVAIVSTMAAIIVLAVVVISVLARGRRQRSGLIVDIGAALHQRIAEPNRTKRVQPRRTHDVRGSIMAQRKMSLFARRLALGAATLPFAALQRGQDFRDLFRRHKERLRHRTAARRANAIARAREHLTADLDSAKLMDDQRAARAADL